MSRYNKDIYENKIHGKENLKVGTSGSNGFEVGGSGNAISASYFFGDGSGLSNVAGGSTVNSFSTIAVSGQSNVVADSSTDTLTFVAGSNVTITTDAGADSITINAAGGGGGSTYSQWMADAPPSSANAKDDEFTSASLSGWTTWNPGSLAFTATTDNNRLVLRRTTSGQSYSGIFKAAPTAPSGDYSYSIWTKVSWICDKDSYPAVGLLLGEDLTNNPGTSAFRTLVLVDITDLKIEVLSWAKFDSYVGTQYQKSVFQPFVYLRARVNYNSGATTTTINYDWSADGIGWEFIGGITTAAGIQYNEIGLAIDNNNVSSTDLRGYFEFFRVQSSNDFFAPCSGSLVEFTLA